MTARDHINLALAHLGDRTRGAARTHALLAIAEAILEITPQDTSHATHSDAQPVLAPQHQPAPTDAPETPCDVTLVGIQCVIPKGHDGLHEVPDTHHTRIRFTRVNDTQSWIDANFLNTTHTS